MRNYPSLSAALIAAIVAGLVALAVPARSARAQIAIDRETVMLNPAQTLARVAEFVVHNDGETAMQATVAMADWDVDARGESHWQRNGRVTGACGSRVTVAPRSLQLAPGARQTVRVSVSGTARFDSECWSAAVVTSSASSHARDTSSAPTVATVPVYVTPSAVQVDGEVRDMHLVGDSIEIVYTNIGNVRHEMTAELQVRTPADSIVLRVPIASATVLAGATRRFRVAKPALSKGTYILFAVADFGGTDLTAARAPLEIR